MRSTRAVAGVRRRGRLLAPLAVVVPLGMLGAFALTGTLRERYGNRDESRVDQGTLVAPAA